MAKYFKVCNNSTINPKNNNNYKLQSNLEE
jgi:hypothetical protein